MDFVDSIVSNNSAHSGGGIFNGNGDVTLIRTVITDNRAVSDSIRTTRNGEVASATRGATSSRSIVLSRTMSRVAQAAVSQRRYRGFRSTGQLSAATRPSMLPALTRYGMAGAAASGSSAAAWILLNSTVSNNTADRQGGGIFCGAGGRVPLCILDDCGQSKSVGSRRRRYDHDGPGESSAALVPALPGHDHRRQPDRWRFQQLSPRYAGHFERFQHRQRRHVRSHSARRPTWNRPGSGAAGR